MIVRAPWTASVAALVGNDVLDHAGLAVLLSILLFATVVAASTARHLRWIAATLATANGILIFVGLGA